MFLCEQSSVDTELTHSGPRLGLSCTVLVDSRDERSDDRQLVDAASSETFSFSNR